MNSKIDDNQLMTLRILWLSFLLTQLGFAVAGWISVSQSSPEPPEPMLLWILAGMGVLTPLLAPLLPPLLLAQSKGPNPAGSTGSNSPIARVFSPFLIGLATREAGAIFAFLILILSGDLSFWLPPAGVAFAMTALAFPSAELFEQWLRA